MSVAVSGGYAYVADFDSGLRVIEVSDPTDPIEVAHCVTPGWARGVAVLGSYAYVADDTAGLRVISVANPASPVEVGHCQTPGRAYGVAIAGGYAYVAADTSGLRVISVADPAHPTEVGYCDTLKHVNSVAVSGSYVYVTDASDGLGVISITDPSHPVRVGGYYMVSASALGVAVSGSLAYVGSIPTTFFPGLLILSVADPTWPVVLGRCDTRSRAWGVAVNGNLAYVAADESGLRVISVADPTLPDTVGYYDMPGWANGVAVAGDYAYVAYAREGLQVFQFYESLGDLDIDPDSLDMVADTLRLRTREARVPASAPYSDYALGEFLLANTSPSYNPDKSDGPSQSPVDSLSYAGSLSGPGGTIDSILILNLPSSLARGQTVTCTLAVYVPTGMRGSDYAGPVTITGKDLSGTAIEVTFCAQLKRAGDLDVDPDSLDVMADTIRVRPRLVSAGPPPTYTEYALGEFMLTNTSATYNPDTADGPSLSPVDSLSYTGSLSGPGGTIDSILILNLPSSLAQGQSTICTLAVYVAPSLRDGPYSGSVTVAGRDRSGALVEESLHVLVADRLGDLDVDNESLDVTSDTMNLHAQPAGPVYSPYAKAEFMLVNTSGTYNPDAADGPSQSILREVKVEAKVEGQGRAARRVNSECRMVKSGSDFHSSQFTLDSSAVGIYVLNLPESLAAGQAVECTLALVLPVGTTPDGYSGWVTISAYDTLGFLVQDSFFLTVRGPEPRQNLDSLRVAPIPFKPNQNPEHDAIHFQGLSSGAKVVVYDASGQSVWSATESGDGHLAWKAEVASGIYVYLVVSADGKASKVGKLSVIR
jgi:hypothetical protein